MVPPDKESLPAKFGCSNATHRIHDDPDCSLRGRQGVDKRANMLNYGLSLIREELQSTRLDIDDAFRSAVKNLIRN
jgi:hypothetical protein